ncbi:GEVED domain-containing protein [Hymenobacter sp. ASUV-10]|uniref:GEVED domain-containing protein n=1 Tax=Hymenobacter aranciens TaxID=3063996 RepID=A0ABT9B7F2_9BACT|nr:GEVED domain-containing protein [Hymenobacter sp. ASUV-10]MDO7874128.1 GEVED domain-containing protein [Hymenobacter sp. ASUV-10]
MKKKLTHFLKLALGALSLGTPLGAQAALVPVPVTGFNQDVIANGTSVAAPAVSTYDVDGSNGGGYCLMVNGGYSNPSNVAATRGLPVSGILNSASVPGLSFQMASYSAANSLRIPATGLAGVGSGTLTLAAPTKAADIYLLYTGGGGTGANAATATVTVTFTDATTQVFAGQSLADWYTTLATDALGGTGRVARTAASGVENNATNPRLHQLKLTLRNDNMAKDIASITVAKTSTANCAVNVFAVSVNTPTLCAAAPTGGTTASTATNVCTNGSVTLSLSGATSAPGVGVQWQSFISGGAGWLDIAGANDPTYVVTGQTATTDYRAVLTCIPTSQSATSTAVTVTQNPFYNCYCTPTSTGGNEYIRSVSVNGASGFTNATNANSTNGYGDFTTNTALTTTLNKGGNYPLSVIVQANNNGSQGGYWIDYDQNGTFDSGEYTEFGRSNLTGQPVTFNSFLTVPNTSAVRIGVTRMRVRWRNGAVAATDACTSGATSWYGETEDYLVTIGAPTVCTGTPPRVTAVASQTAVCSNTPISLTVTGLSAASGFTFQWQSSPTGANTYTNLGGVQTTPTYTVASQTAATDYRLVVTCTGSGLSRTGTEVTVNQNNFLNCYCTPTHSTGCGTYAGLLRVAIPGSGLDHATTCAGTPYYSNVPTTTASGTLSLGNTYTMSVTLGRYAKAGMWIDYDRSGTFEASEYLVIGSNSGNTTGSTATVTPSLTIPSTALTGPTRMRVRTQYFFASTTYPLTATDACTGFIYGETEDYTINLVTPTPCAGVPAASTATASASAVCSTATFTLSLTGIDPALTGLSYQWQRRPAGSGTYTNLGTAQTTPFYSVTGLMADTEYRAVVTCTNGGASSTSSAVRVNNGYLSCYCIPLSGSAGEYITNVTMPGVSGFSSSSTNTSSSPAGFNDYTNNASLTTTVYRGVPYVNGINLTVKSNNTNSQGGMWIDYDHSGTFEASENVFIVNSSATTLVSFLQDLTVPLAAQLGPTRVRVRWRNGTFSNTPANLAAAPCLSGTTTWYGETEDYLITIADAPTCTAPPLTVMATASTSSACANGSFTLSTNSVSTTLGGFTFQWQSRPAGSTGFFTDINGATTNPYTVTGQTAATEYQLIVTCEFGGSPTASNEVTVGQSSFDQCYCATSSTNGCATYGAITNVRIGSIDNTTTCAGTTYTLVAPAATTTTNLDMGLSTPLTLTIGGTNSYRYAVWIDFDHNGTFDASEYLANSTPISTRPLTVSLAIPAASASVLAGPTRMRIRTNSGIAGYPNFSATDACNVTYDGETEDYTVTLVPQTPCAGTPAAPVASASATTVCTGTSFTLSATNPGNPIGLAYQWQSSPAGAGTFTNISGATTNPYTVSSQTAATDYQLVVTCTASSQSSVANIISVAQNSFISCYCTPVATGIGTDGVTRVVLTAPDGTLTNSSSATNVAPYYTDYASVQTAGTLPIPTLYLSGTATLAVTMGTDGTQYSGAWVDFDHSGTFDSNEFFTAGTSAGSGGTSTFTITVPADALTGQTKIRVRGGNDVVLLSTQACTAASSSSNYGEIEDYLVSIALPVPCTATPPTTTAAASVSSACASASFTLSATGVAAGTTGLTYQWQSSPAGANTFAALSGATTNPFSMSSQAAATDYRLVVTCTASGQSSTSNTVSVAQSALADCYCKPTSSSLDEYFTNVTVGSINNTTGNSVASPISGYADYTVSPTATQTTALMRGNTYTITVTARDNRINSQALLYIDFNRNGVFEQTTPEYKVIGNGPTSGSFPQTLTFSTTFTVPTAAPMGLTRLRVRWHNDNNSSDPCALGWNGETEDYTVNIIDADLIVSTTLPIPAGAYNSITITGTGNGTLAGATSVAAGLTVEPGGSFADGCQVLSGVGGFTANAGSTLRICNPAGISASGATGAVQVTGPRSFSPNASYEYNGTASQVTGDGLPTTVRNLMVNNAAHVGLSQATAVRRMLTLANGDLNLGASNLTLISVDTMTAMVVNSGSGRVQNNGSGVAIMQRAATPSTSYSGPGYRHYSSPMTATPLSELGTNTFFPLVNPAYNALPTPSLPLAQFPNVFDYQESRLTATYPGFDIGWHSPSATSDVLTPGKGYTVNIAPQLVDLSGVLNTGPVNTGALSHSGTANSGWQLLGNPYPAPLNWSQVSGLPAGIDASVYVFEPNSQYGGFYRSFVNGMGTNSFDGMLPAMQAFFVRTTQPVPAGFSFQNAHRVTSYTNPAFHRTTADQRPVLRLALGGLASNGTDETIVYLQAGATATGTDAAFDAAKLPNSSGLSVATQLAGPGNGPLAISGLPTTAATVETRLPLTLQVPAAGSYRFDVTALAHFDAGTAVLLLDHQLNTRTDLRQVTSYAFTAAQAGALNGRFELLLGRPGSVTGTAAALASPFSVWPNPASGKAALHVALDAPATKATLTLRTVLGQVVATQTFGGNAATLPTTGLAAGTYLLTVQVAGQAPATRRVVVE